MSFEEMIVALVGAIGAFALVGYLSAKVIDLIKTWINRDKGAIPDEEFDRLAKAFVKYRKETERRLQNLEAIIADDDSKSGPKQQIEAPRQKIEIEDKDSTQQESKSADNSNLRNMLRD